jgi:hypothetical protein
MHILGIKVEWVSRILVEVGRIPIIRLLRENIGR